MNRRPLIAHVLYRLDTGGMEHIVVSLIKATCDRYRHVVITLTGFGTMREEIEDAVEACLSLDKKPGKDWLCYIRFWRVLRELKPDLVQTYNIGTLDLAPVVRLAGVHALSHAEHGRDVTDPDGNNLKYQRLRRWMAPFIGSYIVVSTDLRDWLEDRVGIRSSKVTYIANGIDPAVFQTTRPQATPRRKLAGFAPPGTVLICHVARLDKVKDQTGLLQAFQQLCEKQASANCRLAIVGDGPQRGALERQIVELGLTQTVCLLGKRDDVAELLAECDVFVLSSIAEGMPVTLLEAMAAELPVVATDVGGVASVVESGVTGRLVPPADPQALARALGAYVTDQSLRRRHGSAGRARVVAQFSLDTMASAYGALYDRLLGRWSCANRPRAMSGLPGREEH